MHQHCLTECIEKLYYKKYRVTSTARGWGSTSEVDTTRKVDIYRESFSALRGLRLGFVVPKADDRQTKKRAITLHAFSVILATFGKKLFDTRLNRVPNRSKLAHDFFLGAGCLGWIIEAPMPFHDVFIRNHRTMFVCMAT